MELLHVDDIRPASDGPVRSVKRLFGSIRDFDELVAGFTFYVPVVHHLINDRNRVAISTDIVSHTLAHVMREHPLVVSDLPRTVFRFDERLVLAADQRPLCRTLYAVPTEVWNQTISRLRMLTVFDHSTGRFCVLTPHVRAIRNPIGAHDEFKLPVQFVNCYGNLDIHGRRGGRRGSLALLSSADPGIHGTRGPGAPSAGTGPRRTDGGSRPKSDRGNGTGTGRCPDARDPAGKRFVR